MPYRKSARLTSVTNDGVRDVGAFYSNIDFLASNEPLPQDTLYFHAQYRQAVPNTAVTRVDGALRTIHSAPRTMYTAKRGGAAT